MDIVNYFQEVFLPTRPFLELAYILLFFLLAKIVIYFVQGILSNKVHKQKYEEGSIWVWIPFLNTYMVGYLAANKIIGIFLLFFRFFKYFSIILFYCYCVLYSFLLFILYLKLDILYEGDIEKKQKNKSKKKSNRKSNVK